MGRIQNNFVKLKCKDCKNSVYFVKKNKKKLKDLKLDLKKYCNECKKHTPHLETKK